MEKGEVRRWLRAMKIAKIICQDSGHDTACLEMIAKFVRTRILYRQKISPMYTSILARISGSKNIPMTRLVNQIILAHLKESKENGGEVKDFLN